MDSLAQSRYVIANGIRIHYRVAGKGPPLILIHGLGASWITWRDNLGSLSQAFRVHALDLPGHGNSDKPPISYHSTEVLNILSNAIEAMGIDKTAIIGNSIGGSLAIMMGLRYPHLVSKIVLVNSASLGQEINFYLRLLSIPLLGKVLESRHMNGTGRMLKNVFFNHKFASQDLFNELSYSRSLPGAKQAVIKVIRNTVNLMGVRGKYVLLDQLKSLKHPIMVIWGAQDRILPVSHAYRALDKIPKADFHVFEQCGHWPQMEKAVEFNSLVLNFLTD